MPENNFSEAFKKLADSAQSQYLMPVPALKGHMGGVDYYLIVLPFTTAVRFLTWSDRNLPPRERENRKPTPARYGQIAEYIQKNPDDYRFSSLTCTFGKDGTTYPPEWNSPVPSGEGSNIGLLTLDLRDPVIIVDGQHRFGAIKKVVEEDPSLSDETISIVLFPYTDIRHAQQLFSDLNRTAKKTTKSLDILFDYRDVVNRVVQAIVVDRVSVFKDRVNLEDAAVPANSNQMFTLAGIYQATKPIIDALPKAGLLPEELGKRDASGKPRANEDIYVDYLSKVWEFIALQFPEWGEVASGHLDIRDNRGKFLHWHSGVISAVGEFVAVAMREKGSAWQQVVQDALTHPDTHGWRRNAPEWQGIIVTGTQVLPRSAVRPQLKAYLKSLAELPLSDADKEMLKAIMERKKQLAITPEEKLLHAIFGERKAQGVKDSSP